jgi:hypothetical protein
MCCSSSLTGQLCLCPVVTPAPDQSLWSAYGTPLWFTWLWLGQLRPIVRGWGLKHGVQPLCSGTGPRATKAHCPSCILQEVDWEVELAVVIGKKGKHIKVRWKGGPGLQWNRGPGSGLCWCWLYSPAVVLVAPGAGKWSAPNFPQILSSPSSTTFG